MSERIVNDPSQHGWVEEDGKWVWDGQSSGSIEDGDTEGQITTWSGAEWTPESSAYVEGGDFKTTGNLYSGALFASNNLVVSKVGGCFTSYTDETSGVQWRVGNASDNGFHVYRPASGGFSSVTPFIIDDSGNVGIGTGSNSITAPLDVNNPTGKIAVLLRNAGAEVLRAGGEFGNGYIRSLQDLHFETGGSTKRLTIDGSGNVGIGTDQPTKPLVVQNPVNQRSFEVEPTDDYNRVINFDRQNVEYIPVEFEASEMFFNVGTGSVADIRALTIDSTGYLTVSSGRILRDIAESNAGLIFSSEALYPALSDGSLADDHMSLGGASNRWKDGHFSGTVDAAGFTVNGVPIGGGGGNVDLTGYATEEWVNSQGFSKTDTKYNAATSSTYGLVKIGYGENNKNYAVKTSNGQMYVSVPWTDSGNTTYTAGNGLTLSGTQFKMSGSYTGSFTASGDVTAYSDVRLKEDVNTLDGSKVFDMRGVSFTKDGKAGSGVIAQELQKIAPELVHDDEQYLSVAYGNLVGYLIESVKMLKAEIEELKRDTA